MNKKKYQQLQGLLESYGSLSSVDIQNRLYLIRELDALVESSIGVVKGICLFGSILNDKFNCNSDIDFAVMMNSKENYLEHELRVMRTIEAETGIEANPILPYGVEDIPKIRGEFFINIQHVPFGVYLGEESFRDKIITEILSGFSGCRKVHLWPEVQKNFEWWGNKDLINSQRGYKLSEYDSLRTLYVE